jgi:hypothetical protein
MSDKKPREKRITLIFDTQNEKQIEMYENLKNLSSKAFRGLPNYIKSELAKVIEKEKEEIKK